MRLAITGATGFVGGRLLAMALAEGHEVRALTRRAQPPRENVTWVEGALDRPDSLALLCAGADAVIHVAGVINAADASEFEAGNVTGTENMLAAAQAAGLCRFVHVSSLAAREPTLSHYGGSKLRSEGPVSASPLQWAIVRPPAVYGPGDREILELFKRAKRGFVLLPPKGRLSVIHVDDLARLLLALAHDDAPSHLTVEPDDGRPGAWTHEMFARALGTAVGRKVVPISTHKALLRLGALVDGWVRRAGAKLTPDRVNYFCHPDWTASTECGPPAALWRAEIDTGEGLAETALWYREQGWL